MKRMIKICTRLHNWLFRVDILSWAECFSCVIVNKQTAYHRRLLKARVSGCGVSGHPCPPQHWALVEVVINLHAS